MKPVVFILDIDGTLIGDISQQVMMFDMLDEIKASKKLLDMDEFNVKTATLIYKYKSRKLKERLGCLMEQFY